MTISPEKLRAVAAAGHPTVLMPAEGSMLADAMEIADSCARADIESLCHPHGEGEDFHGWAWDVDSVEKDDRPTVNQALRYLDARGVIEYQTADGKRMVRFKERPV